MFRVGEVDVAGLRQFENMLGALGGAEGTKAANRAINRAGDMAKTQVIRALARQTALPQKTIRRAVKVKRSSWSDLTYTLTSAGGDVSLKFFQARETRAGVTYRLPGGRELYAGAFIRGGAFPHRRVELNMGQHVFARTGTARLPIEKLKSGVFIPAEMVEGATADAFNSTVQDVLPRRLSHEISRSLGL